MKYDIDCDEWYPVYVPSFVSQYDTMYENTPEGVIEFTEEEVYIIKNAFILFKSSQEMLKEKIK